jgi:RNase PH
MSLEISLSKLDEFGKNKILAGVFGPRDVHPKHMANPDSGILRCRYHMSPFS